MLKSTHLVLLAVLACGLSQNTIINASAEEAAKRNRQSIIRGAKLLATGVSLHFGLSYIANEYFPKPKDESRKDDNKTVKPVENKIKTKLKTFGNLYANSILAGLLAIANGISILGAKSIYDGSVGYYI